MSVNHHNHFRVFFHSLDIPSSISCSRQQAGQNVYESIFISAIFSHVMFKDDSNVMHVQPSLPEVGIHGEDGLPVGSKLGLRGIFGSTVLQ